MDKQPNPQGLFSALEKLENARKKTAIGCGLGAVLKELSDREREKLETILKDRNIPSTQITQVLESNGYKVHVSTVRYHRNGYDGKGCQCSRTT